MDNNEKLRQLQNLTKSSLDQLLSMLSEISNKDIVELQDIGREVIDKAKLTPGIRSTVKAIFCVGCATLVLARKEMKDEEEQKEDDDEEGE